MFKRTISVMLLFLLSVSLFAVPAFAESSALDFSTPPDISKPEIITEGGSSFLQIKVKTPASVRSVMDFIKIGGKRDYISSIGSEFSLEGGAWQEVNIAFAGSGDKWNGTWRTDAISGLSETSWVQVRVRYTGMDNDGNPVLSNWSNVLTINEPPEKPESSAEESFDFNAHDWAKPELKDADSAGLIPADLRTADLKEPITRAEFAAVSVKVYEALSGLKAEPAAVNPFTDTADAEVLKALNVGITNGISDTEFGPAKLLNREQAATMLSRVYKKVAFEGWTLGTDGDFAEAFRALFTMPEAFTDDADISSWARDSVYFMVYNGILKGMEGYT